jgi:hypothetical protein
LGLCAHAFLKKRTSPTGKYITVQEWALQSLGTRQHWPIYRLTTNSCLKAGLLSIALAVSILVETPSPKYLAYNVKHPLSISRKEDLVSNSTSDLQESIYTQWYSLISIEHVIVHFQAPRISGNIYREAFQELSFAHIIYRYYSPTGILSWYIQCHQALTPRNRLTITHTTIYKAYDRDPSLAQRGNAS